MSSGYLGFLQRISINAPPCISYLSVSCLIPVDCTLAGDYFTDPCATSNIIIHFSLFPILQTYNNFHIDSIQHPMCVDMEQNNWQQPRDDCLANRTARTFHLFPRLPAEIRIAIWQHFRLRCAKRGPRIRKYLSFCPTSSRDESG